MALFLIGKNIGDQRKTFVLKSNVSEGTLSADNITIDYKINSTYSGPNTAALTITIQEQSKIAAIADSLYKHHNYTNEMARSWRESKNQLPADSEETIKVNNFMENALEASTKTISLCSSTYTASTRVEFGLTQKFILGPHTIYITVSKYKIAPNAVVATKVTDTSILPNLSTMNKADFVCAETPKCKHKAYGCRICYAHHVLANLEKGVPYVDPNFSKRRDRYQPPVSSEQPATKRPRTAPEPFPGIIHEE